jgi:uncharacterized protein (TIGR00251 family)
MLIEVRVKPGSKRDHISTSEESKGRPLLIVELKAQPQDGKANAALIKLLAKHFGVTQAEIRIKRGVASKNKFIEVTSSK